MEAPQASLDPRSGDLLQELQRWCVAQKADLPRVALLLFDCASPDDLERILQCIPPDLEGCLEEILVVTSATGPAAPPGADALQAAVTRLSDRQPFALRLHLTPGDFGYGGARKSAVEDALREGFDQLVVMRGDGTHPPEALPALLHAALVEDHGLVLASRLGGGSDAPRARVPLVRRLALRATTWVQNRVLGNRAEDPDSGFRIYSSRALRAIPFQLDALDRLFDVELGIQHRALGVSAHEVPVEGGWREAPTVAAELAFGLRACKKAIGYRLHQLHVIRRGRYFVDHGIHYTLKESATGSHMQIVDAIPPDQRVLDLGCSQGLLAEPLLAKNVRVTGVDFGPGEQLAEDLADYFQRDLEMPLELPTGRVFDYVVIADVIEHLRNRSQLLRDARRLLKPGGRLIISTPNVALWFYRLSLLVGRFEYGPRGVLDYTHVHLFTRDSFRREVEGSGYSVVAERVTALPFEVVFESTGRSRLMRRLASFYHGLARVWPEMFAYQIILEAEITTLDEEATVAGERE